MARQPTGNPTGRPPKEINWELFEQLCLLQCTQSEIASTLKINPDTLRDRAVEHYGESYSEIYKRYSENGKTSLRRYQYIQAKTKPNMAIWLGKQWLGQKDKEEITAPKNDEILTQILQGLSIDSNSKILELTKANEMLQDQIKNLQAQLEEGKDARNAGLRRDATLSRTSEGDDAETAGQTSTA